MRGYFGPEGNKTLLLMWICIGEDMKKIIAAVVLAIFGIAATAPAWAHSGGTDKNGCHRNHKTGDRHCH